MTEPRAAATLRYDSTCPFCIASARWIERRARGRIRVEGAPGIRAAALEAAGRRTRTGGAAVTAALAQVPGWRAVAVLDAPGLVWLRDAGYALVARVRPLLSRIPAVRRAALVALEGGGEPPARPAATPR